MKIVNKVNLGPRHDAFKPQDLVVRRDEFELHPDRCDVLLVDEARTDGVLRCISLTDYTLKRGEMCYPRAQDCLPFYGSVTITSAP